MRHPGGEGDSAVRWLASRQRGLVHRWQLLAAGIGRGGIRRRVEARRLVRRQPCVYLVGHDALAPWATEMAAALRYRGNAVISHRSAAAIWGLIPRAPVVVELTIVGTHARSTPGIRFTRTKTLDRKDFRWRHDVPVTGPARTIIDLAGCAESLITERAIVEARAHGLASDAELRRAADRCPQRKGVGWVNAFLEAERDPAMTRSKAERMLAGLCDRAGLPRPISGARLCGFEVDQFWPHARLVVEFDGYGAHSHRGAFERDRYRDQVLIAAGYRVLRVTWHQLTREPTAVIVRIGQAMVAAAGAA
jgi:hypothetical protein